MSAVMELEKHVRRIDEVEQTVAAPPVSNREFRRSVEHVVNEVSRLHHSLAKDIEGALDLIFSGEHELSVSEIDTAGRVVLAQVKRAFVLTLNTDAAIRGRDMPKYPGWVFRLLRETDELMAGFTYLEKRVLAHWPILDWDDINAAFERHRQNPEDGIDLEDFIREVMESPEDDD